LNFLKNIFIYKRGIVGFVKRCVTQLESEVWLKIFSGQLDKSSETQAGHRFAVVQFHFIFWTNWTRSSESQAG
jgi:hypothetical protein